MGRGQRVGLILAAAAIAVVAFVLLRPDEAEDPGPPATAPVETQPGDGEAEAPAEPEPEPEVVTLRIVDGEPEGGAQRIRVERGETVRIRVESDTPDEIHVHGYEIIRDVGPGQPARMRFEADIEGIFEIEAHDLGHLLLARLVVEP